MVVAQKLPNKLLNLLSDRCGTVVLSRGRADESRHPKVKYANIAPIFEVSIMKIRLRILLCVLILLSSNAFAGSSLGLRTVVIDAGHGGKDPGAVSPDGKSYEKTFALDIATRLAGKIRADYPEVNVKLTREDDRFVTLGGRADIANKAGADLFISIHINASTGSAANGYSVHVLGQSRRKDSDLYKANLDMVRRENSVILLDDDYEPGAAGFDPSDPESYIFMTLVQSAYLEQSIAFAQTVSEHLDASPFRTDRGVSQDPFYVLWKTSMPAVLIELGFMSNSGDLAVLKSSNKRDDIADCLFKAFASYKQDYDKSMSVKASEASAPAAKPIEPVETAGAVSSLRYGVQIASLSKKLSKGDSRLLGYEPLFIKSESGKFWRCIIALSSSEQEAKDKCSSIRRSYPDCFVVKVENGKSVERVH